MSDQSLNQPTQDGNLKKLEQKFIRLYKNALKLKNECEMTQFFTTDNNLQLICDEIKVLTGEDDLSVKKRLIDL